MNDSKQTGLLILNAIVMLATMIYYYGQSDGAIIIDILYILILVVIGTYVYMNTAPVPAASWFLGLMYTTAWILLHINGPSRISFGMGRALMSLAPNLLFVFFVYFMNLPRNGLFRWVSRVLLLSAIITSVALLSFQPMLSYILYVHLLLAVLGCIWLASKYRSKQRRVVSQYQRILNGSILAALLPFVITNTLLGSFLPSWVKLYSIYTFIALPLAVGYILIKQNRLQTSLNYNLMAKQLLLLSAGVAALLSFSVYAVGLSFIQALLVLAAALTVMVIQLLLLRRYATKQLYAMNQTKEKLEKERLDILQQLTYDDYLSTLSKLIKQFIEKTISLNGTLLIWKEQGRCYILEQNGIFETFSLSKMDPSQWGEKLFTWVIDQNTYFVFPLKYKNVVNGWLITGHKANGEKFTPEEVSTLSIMADAISEILKTTEILHDNQRRYINLPSIQYEDYLNITLVQRVEEIRKSLALYLHDDVLQSILAIKNMAEIMETSRPELQHLILETLRNLNHSIREKMFDIYPTTLADLGLYQSLSILCEKVQREAVLQPELKIRLEAEATLEVDPELQYTVFRTVKELLQNAIKHAEATEIVVSLHLSGSGGQVLNLDVKDDGKGFDIASQLSRQVLSDHIGLLSVKQEIQSLQGEFSIRKNPDSGTHIQIRLPMKGRGREHARTIV